MSESDFPVFIGGQVVRLSEYRARERIERELAEAESDVLAIGAAIELLQESVYEARWRKRKIELQQRALNGASGLVYKTKWDALLNARRR